MTHLGHICFPLCPITATQWVKKTGLDHRYSEENEQALNYPGESANSIKSTKEKEPATSIFQYSAQMVLGGA